jgi:hypothetical protein
LFISNPHDQQWFRSFSNASNGDASASTNHNGGEAAGGQSRTSRGLPRVIGDAIKKPVDP